MRRNSYTGKYKLTKNEYLNAYYYALLYNTWKDRCNTGSLDKAEIEKIKKKMELIEQTAIEADGDIYQYILKAVTNVGITYHYLKTVMDIPCGKDMYYDRRRKFYWLLAQRL